MRSVSLRCLGTFLVALASFLPATVLAATCTTVIHHPAPAAGTRFGYALAISGNRLLVGSPAFIDGSAGNGRAFLYDLDTGQLLKTLQRPTPLTGDRFGGAVGFSGADLLIGAPTDDLSGVVMPAVANAGAMYLFDGTAPGTTLLRTFHATSPQTSDFLGQAVGAIGPTVFGGAPGFFGDGNVFSFAGGTGVAATTYPNPAPAPFPDLNPALHGNTVAMIGSTLLVGTPGQGGTAFPDYGPGAAYAYTVGNATPTRTFANPTPANGEAFGFALASDGTKIAIGALGDSDVISDGGAVYVYDDLADTTPLVLRKPMASAGDELGGAVAFAGSRIAAAAVSDNTGAANAGAVYLFDATGAVVATFQRPAPEVEGHFGLALAATATKIVVGAPDDDTDGTDAGAVYVCDVPAGGATPTPTVTTTATIPASATPTAPVATTTTGPTATPPTTPTTTSTATSTANPTTNPTVTATASVTVTASATAAAASPTPSPTPTAATPFVPPDAASLKCERGVAKNLTTLANALMRCDAKAVGKAFKTKAFDLAACRNGAVTKFDAADAKLEGCPPCIDATVRTGLRDDTRAAVIDLGAELYCDGTTALPSGVGFVPTTKTALACENAIGTNVGSALKCISTCLVNKANAVFKDKSFDETACVSTQPKRACLVKYGEKASKRAECVPCQSAAHLQALLATLRDRLANRAVLFCNGTVPF